MKNNNTRRGFTLIELIVAVLIIAVLAAVAVPQYKKSVLKSRFSTVMPMAKAVADAQEVYFLANGQYSVDKTYLDITPLNVENTEVELSTAAEDENYNYVAAKRTDYPNARYIIYQKHSPKFAGNIHCEAKAAADEENNEVWLCRDALQGVEVNGSVQGSGYRTFRLAGNEGSTFTVEPTLNTAEDLVNMLSDLVDQVGLQGNNDGWYNLENVPAALNEKFNTQYWCENGECSLTLSCKSCLGEFDLDIDSDRCLAFSEEAIATCQYVSTNSAYSCKVRTDSGLGDCPDS